MKERLDRAWLWLRSTSAEALKWVVLVSIIVAIFVAIRVLLSPAEIGTVATENEAITRANERLLDMVKWTISTVLLIGGGLIGLNWYTNEQRYQNDKKEQEGSINSIRRSVIDLIESNSRDRVSVLNDIHDAKMDITRLTDQLTQLMLYPEGPENSGGIVTATIRLLNRPDATQIVKRRALDYVVWTFSDRESPRSFLVFMGLAELPELIQLVRKQGYSDISETLDRRYDALKELLLEKPK